MASKKTFRISIPANLVIDVRATSAAKALEEAAAIRDRLLDGFSADTVYATANRDARIYPDAAGVPEIQDTRAG